MRSGRPPSTTPVPTSVRELIAGRRYEVVWRNEVGGLTFAVEAEAGRQFVKWAPAGAPVDLAAEVDRLHWAAAFARVPRVLASGRADDGSWLVTAGLPGDSAVSERWRADPGTAVDAIGGGLRALHDMLPVAGCPFTWSAASRIADRHRRAGDGRLDATRWHREHRAMPLARAIELIEQPPEIDALVVCHGDACAPNTLIGGDGRWVGHVDMGGLGVADRWADLAVATWSTQWNYGPGWEGRLLDAYGVDPDPARTAYYRLLWDLGG